MSAGFARLSGNVANATTSLADVDPGGGGQALLAAVASGALVYFDMGVPFQSSNVGTGIAIAENGPGSPTMYGALYELPISTTQLERGQQKAYDQNSPSSAIDIINSDIFGRIRGAIKDSGGGGGNMMARFAAEIANNVTVLAGAWAYWETITNGNGRHTVLSGDVATTSETLVDVDPGGGGQILGFPMLANADYDFIVCGWYRSSAISTGIGWGLNGPASPNYVCAQVLTGRQPAAMTYLSIPAYGTKVDNVNLETANVDNLFIINGIVSNGANAGNLMVQTGRETGSGAGTVTVKANSFTIRSPRV